MWKALLLFAFTAAGVILAAADAPRCRKDEVYTDFKHGGCKILKCSELGFPLKCDQRKPGCICKDNKIRSDDGCCVSVEECPSCRGDPNAKSGCGSNCGKTCSTYKNKPDKCPFGCIFNGCTCKDGFVHDPNVQKCVLPSECTPTCGENEVFSTCINGGCDARDCSQVGKPVPCVKIDPKYCIKGCVCATGYLRASNGTCVPKDQCGGAKCTGQNELFDTCISDCGSQNCSDIGKIFNCPIQPAVCRTGCRCNPGFYRNTDNVCVAESECPCGGDPNAEPGCGVNCGRTCTTYKSKPGACPDICIVGGCDCKEDFVFDNVVKKCVLPADCSKCTGENEFFDTCISGCGSQNCSDIGKIFNCPIQPAVCRTGCRCNPGFYRNTDNVCVAESECPCGGDPNAEPGCGVNCGRTCTTYKSKPGACPDICLVGGCDCKEDFVFDNVVKKCVLPADCSAPPCPDGETYDECPTVRCDGDYCPKTRDSPLTCPVGIVCDPPRCVCGFNSHRNRKTGKCIATADCPPFACNGPNEEYQPCPPSCPGENCTDYINNTTCPRFRIGIVVPCKPQCKCKKGYYRNADGVCIIGSKCETGSCGGDPNAKPGCGVNCGKTCSTYKVKHPICPFICKENGCDCKDNYVFDPNVQKCVLPEDCTPICGANEVFSTCINGGCETRNCSQVGKSVPCMKIDPKYCIKGCVCATGYLQASNGTCVPKYQCSGGCGGDPNAEPGCGVNCGRTCTTYKSKPGACPDICVVGGCDCKKDFVFDNVVGKCVLPSDCSPRCGQNEIVSTCSNGGCGHFNCSDLGKPILCIDPIKCTKGCVCQNTYLRAENGTCVPKDQCPGPCGGDPNAKPGCGVNCGKTCSTYQAKNPICPLICKVNGCDCKDGFVFDPNQQKCVRPEDCTPICGQNEIVSTCSNGGCGPFNCSDLGKPILCIDPIKCTKGCVCQNTYLRAENGTCVPKDQCPGPCGGDPNAKPGCGVNCGKTCSTYQAKNPICPLICKVNGCDCKDGFVFDPNQQKCIRPEDCTPTCGLNEVYSPCTNGGCDARNCSQVGKPVPCVKINPKYCIKGCVCNTGYLRASNGTCVPKDQCPSKCPNPNEVFDVCPAPCPPRRCDVDDRVIRCAAPPTPGDPACKPGCRCADNYARNAKGICVPRSECDQPENKCRENELFNPCTRTCPPQKCGIDPALVLCANPGPEVTCQPGCDCVDGYVRNDTDVCIPKDQCPKCTGQNEFFDTCISGCGSQNCSDIGKIFHCPIQPAVCRTGCRCNPGFYRNTDNVCVPESECPAPPCPDGETYNRCPTVRCDGDYCPKTRDSPLTCPVGIVCDPPRCVCGFNSRRNRKTGKCIATADCPPFACNGPNEKYQPCPASCPGENCSDYINNTTCPRFKIGIVVPCKPQCKCKKGYYRNADGICIIGHKCPGNKCRKNEVFTPCKRTCPPQKCGIDPALVLCARPDPDVPCQPGCECADGYVRNDADVCIPKDQCPGNKCRKNEVFTPCKRTCPPQKCGIDPALVWCARPDPDVPCQPGCECVDGYVRNDADVCIPKDQCPGNKCRKNEVFTPCKRTCPPQKCGIDPALVLCARPDPDVPCQPGCECVDGYVRNDADICIPKNQCPPFACNGPNEEYQSCPATCPGEKCSDYITNSKCPPFRIGIVVPCKPQCKCKKGYYRNDDNVCISGCKCGPKNTDTTTLPPTTKPINGGDGNGSVNTTTLQAGIADFTGKFLYNRIQASKGENVIISPYSVFTPLAQLALYAVGEALKQLLAILHLNSKEEIRSKFPALVASYEGQTSVNFSQAALVCINKNTPATSSFKQDSVDVFQAETRDLNFADAVRAAADINLWVANKTDNKITDLVSPDMFSPATSIALINALAFKGTWFYQFDEKNTQDQAFFLEDGTNKTTKLMYQEAEFNYGEFPEYGCKMLQMWYLGQNFSMVAVLPDQIDGVTNLAKTLQDFSIFYKLYNSLTSQKVKVWFPKFEIKTTTDLAEILKQLNVKKIFNETDSELRDIIADQKQNLHVTAAVQEAVIKVEEKGSEAYAANAFVIGPRTTAVGPRENSLEFKADHGFIFVIFVKGNSGTTDPVTLFTGTFKKP